MTISISSPGSTSVTLAHGHTPTAGDGGNLASNVVDQTMTKFTVVIARTTDITLTTTAASIGLDFVVNTGKQYLLEYNLYYTLAAVGGVDNLFITFSYPTLSSGGLGILQIDANFDKIITLGTTWSNAAAFTITPGLCTVYLTASFSVAGVFKITPYASATVAVVIKSSSFARQTIF